jgi:hypothetical protein
MIERPTVNIDGAVPGDDIKNYVPIILIKEETG